MITLLTLYVLAAAFLTIAGVRSWSRYTRRREQLRRFRELAR